MYHFVQYLYHFIFILLIMTLVVPYLHNLFMVLLIFSQGNFKICVKKPIFFGFWFPQEGGGICACVGMVCYHCIVHILNSSKKHFFFLTLTAICAKLCCQTTIGHIPLLYAKLEPQRRHLRRKNMAQVYPKSWF